MQLLILLIVAVTVAIIANTKGRSPVGWFFIGFFTSFIGLILILVMSDLKEEQAQRLRVEQENRRLREQLRQERLKQESFREYTQRRLDVHDERLGIDTRSLAPLPQPAGAALPDGDGHDVPAPAATVGSPSARGWYYEQDGETQGPVPAAAIRRLLQIGELRSATLVWAEHLKDWTPIDDTQEFRGLAST